MKLEWMGEYREFVEQLIKYCNYYTQSYKKENYYGTEIPISFEQIQVVEYILENEERQQNMSEVASRLGITLSNFSKLTNKLVTKGLLEKFHTEDNKKEIIVLVTEYGKMIYQQYAKTIYEGHFKAMFEAGDALPKEYLPVVCKMIGSGLQKPKKKPPKEKVLIPVEKK